MRDRAQALRRRAVQRDQVQHKTVIKQTHPFQAACLTVQRDRQFFPGRVPVGVDDPRMAVPALSTERQLPVHLIQRHPPIDQFVDPLARARHDLPNDRLVTQPGPGDHRVVHVLIDAVVLVDHHADPALGPVGVRVLNVALGRDDDIAVLLRRDRRTQPGHAPTDHQCVGKDLRQQRRTERDQVSAVIHSSAQGLGIRGQGSGVHQSPRWHRGCSTGHSRPWS